LGRVRGGRRWAQAGGTSPLQTARCCRVSPPLNGPRAHAPSSAAAASRSTAAPGSSFARGASAGCMPWMKMKPSTSAGLTGPVGAGTVAGTSDCSVPAKARGAPRGSGRPSRKVSWVAPAAAHLAGARQGARRGRSGALPSCATAANCQGPAAHGTRPTVAQAPRRRDRECRQWTPGWGWAGTAGKRPRQWVRRRCRCPPCCARRCQRRSPRLSAAQPTYCQ
jgi:hypothetical protein